MDNILWYLNFNDNEITEKIKWGKLEVGFSEEEVMKNGWGDYRIYGVKESGNQRQ